MFQSWLRTGHTCSDSGGDAVLGTGLTMRCNNHGLSVVITAVIDFIVIGRQVQIHPLTPPTLQSDVLCMSQFQHEV